MRKITLADIDDVYEMTLASEASATDRRRLSVRFNPTEEDGFQLEYRIVINGIEGVNRDLEVAIKLYNGEAAGIWREL